MARLILCLALNLLIMCSNAQSNLEWYNLYGSNIKNNTNPKYYPKLKYENENLIISGIINNPGDQRFAKVMYKKNGDYINQTILGNDSVKNNYLNDYTFDKNGNVYLLHSESIETYKYKMIIQKYSPNGDLRWIKQIYDDADTSYSAYSMEIIRDSILLVNGYKEYDYPPEPTDAFRTVTELMLYAFNTDGSDYWHQNISKDLGLAYFSYPFVLIDDRVVFFAFGMNNEYHIVKVDPIGNSIHKVQIEYPHSINTVLPFNSENLLITSLTGRFEITQINLNGKNEWSNYYITNLPSNVFADEAIAVCKDMNENIYVTGRHYGKEYNTSNYTNGDILTIKYDSLGNELWVNRYEYKVNNCDIGNKIFATDDYVYVGGHSESNGISTDYDYVVLKLNSKTGKSEGEYRFNGDSNGDDILTDLLVFDDGKVALTGLVKTTNSFSWGTQLLTDITTSIKESESIATDKFKIYPNPILPNVKELTISTNNMKDYSIIDINGNAILSGQINGLENLKISIDNLASGIYILKVSNDYKYLTKKIIKQ